MLGWRFILGLTSSKDDVLNGGHWQKWVFFCFVLCFFETKQLKGNKNVSNFLFIQKDKKKLVYKLVL